MTTHDDVVKMLRGGVFFAFAFTVTLVTAYMLTSAGG